MDAFDGLTIPTYIINITQRTERLSQVLNQFEGKQEFDVKVVKACEHKIDAIGLWQNITKVINLAIQNEDDVIIICADDHEFTEHYTKEYLLQNIIEANEQGCAILTGGIEGFGHAVPLTANRMWLNPFQSTQFMVLYKPIFERVLAYKFKKTDTGDSVLSQITSHKMVLFPFISRQRDLGCSDNTTVRNEQPVLMGNLTKGTEERLKMLQQMYVKYKNQTN